MTQQGIFIILEGIDGSGKTSQAEKLAKTIEDRGREVVLTQEPEKKSGSLGGWVRQQLLHQRDNRLSDEALTHLLLAARHDHIEKTILPNIKAGKVVISDRFSHSTIAYQGYGLGVDIDIIKKMTQLVEKKIKADRVFIIDIDPALAQERLKDKQIDMMEQRGLDFFHKVRQGFLSLADEDKKTIKVIDGNQPPQEIEKTIWQEVNSLLS